LVKLFFGHIPLLLHLSYYFSPLVSGGAFPRLLHDNLHKN
jgi:hypothetical protein